MSRNALRIASVAAAGLVAACVVLRFDLADPWILFSYSSDALIHAAWAKAILEQGWIHTNRALGAPFGQAYYDFPLFESVNLLLQKLLGWVGGNYAFAVNCYYVLTFPLTAACSYGALTALRVSALPSAIVSVLYALLPYHLYRAEVHLFLSGYHFVPLSALVALWIARSDLTVPSRRFVTSVVVILLTAGSGIYYGFFAAYFLLVAAVLATIRNPSWRTPLVTGALLGILVFGGLLNVVPSISYWSQNGTTVVVRRTPADSTQYGFRIASALMPIPDHRVTALARLRESFSAAVAPATSVGNGAHSLGFVASAGFLGLLVVPFLPRISAAFRETLLALSCLTHAGVLLATTNGFGQLFAFFVTPDVRCWDRIVPFLAFFALTAVAITMDQVRALARTRAARAAFVAGAVGLGVLAIADQTSPQLVPRYDRVIAEVSSDREFFGGIEETLPRDSMLFQLPYVPFPESPPRHRLVDYDLLRPYLSTASLRWSYGAVRTRFADAWIGSVARLPIPQLVDALVLAEFRGIVVDRYGYEDGGAHLDEELRRVAGRSVSESRNGRYTWYRLDARTAQLRSAIGGEEWARRSERLMRPFYLEWQRGFYAIEGGPDANHRWSDSESVLAIDNPRTAPARVRLTASVCTGRREPAAFTMRSAELDYSTKVSSRCVDVDFVTVLPPGRSRIRFATRAARARAPGDDRALHFVLRDFRFAVDGGGADVVQNM